jgi:hypothetical protein
VDLARRVPNGQIACRQQPEPSAGLGKELKLHIHPLLTRVQPAACESPCGALPVVKILLHYALQQKKNIIHCSRRRIRSGCVIETHVATEEHLRAPEGKASGARPSPSRRADPYFSYRLAVHWNINKRLIRTVRHIHHSDVFRYRHADGNNPHEEMCLSAVSMRSLGAKQRTLTHGLDEPTISLALVQEGLWHRPRQVKQQRIAGQSLCFRSFASPFSLLGKGELRARAFLWG